MEKKNPSFMEVYDRSSSPIQRDHLKAGYAVKVLCQSSSKNMRGVNYFKNIIMWAIEHQQIKFMFNEDGDPVAYVVWASLSSDVEQRILDTHRVDIHFSEWNEGDSLWVLDLVCCPGYLKYVLRFLRDNTFFDKKTIRYLRHIKNKSRVSELDRSQMAGCLRSMPPASKLCRCEKLYCDLTSNDFK